MCPSVHAYVQSTQQHSFVPLRGTMWRWFGGVVTDVSAARMTSFPGLPSPVTSEGFLLKSSISPCPSVVQPHPKASADSSIRTLPIACPAARHYRLYFTQWKSPPPPPSDSSQPLSFLFPCLLLPLHLQRALNFSIHFHRIFFSPDNLLWSLVFVWSHCLWTLQGHRPHPSPPCLLPRAILPSCPCLHVGANSYDCLFHSLLLCFLVSHLLCFPWLFQMQVFDIHLLLVGFYRPSQ